MANVGKLQWSHAQPNVETERKIGERRKAGPLQWSHAQPNVETKGQQQIKLLQLALQWSHAQPNVETRMSRSQPFGCSFRFNGATLSRTWKLAEAAREWAREQGASMEPRSAERGNP